MSWWWSSFISCCTDMFASSCSRASACIWAYLAISICLYLSSIDFCLIHTLKFSASANYLASNSICSYFFLSFIWVSLYASLSFFFFNQSSMFLTRESCIYFSFLANSKRPSRISLFWSSTSFFFSLFSASFLLTHYWNVGAFLFVKQVLADPVLCFLADLRSEQSELVLIVPFFASLLNSYWDVVN